METVKIGVIGGSGLYEMKDLEILDELEIPTPFGMPSDKIVVAELFGKKIAFLPRHGKGHRIPPHLINYRANIWALKSLGVEFIISVSAVGSMKEKITPGSFVIVDQFIDLTRKRKQTFFEDGVVAHVAFADPVCPLLSEKLADACQNLGLSFKKGGIYLCIEGPQFSTRAESLLYRSWGVDVIGMTNATEARLAREAEICYATIAMVTDYDCWHEEEEDVSADAVIKTLMENVEKAKNVIKEAVRYIPFERNCGCKNALETAIVTAKEAISPEAKRKLSLLLDKYLK